MLDVTNILIAMARHRLNRGELAERANLSSGTITAVLAGKDTRVSTLCKLAEVLDADPRDFILSTSRSKLRDEPPAA